MRRAFRTFLAVLTLSSVAAAQHPQINPGADDPTQEKSGGFSAEGVLFLGQIPFSDFPGNSTLANDCWGYVSPSGREYALLGLESGLGVIEVSDPLHPAIIGWIDGPDSLWRDVKVIGDYAYVVSEGGSGIQVVDLRQVDSGAVSFVRQVGSGATHNIAANPDTGFLYRCGGSGNGLRIYNAGANPTNPPFVGEWQEAYVHDAQIVVWQRPGPYLGRELAFCCSGLGDSGFTDPRLRIVDVTDKANPITIGSVAYSNRQYSHQGWLTPDQHYFYLDDELDEDAYRYTTRTRIIDVSDPTSPVEVGWFTSGSTSIDHNLYTKGNYIYESNYRSGLRIFDATIPTAPVQVAWLDTFPADDAVSFDGNWSNYPYFPSGTIILSDIQQGLIICREFFNRLDFAYPDGQPEFFHPDGGTVIRVDVEGAGNVNLDPDSIVLHFDNGSGEVQIPATEIGAGMYELRTPSVDCEAQVSWWVSGRSLGGDTFTDPPLAPMDVFTAMVASSSLKAFQDAFETQLAWTVTNSVGLSSGEWQRGVPANGNRGDPPADYDGSGKCYLTDNFAGDSDVDGGTTTLTSPSIDATGGRAILSYARWFNNSYGGNPQQDVFLVEVSNNDGASWTTLETVGPTGSEVIGGWFHVSYVINEVFPAPSNTFRVRFTASDLSDFPSVVEAAIDDVSVRIVECEPTQCPGDLTGDGATDSEDFFLYLDLFAAGDSRADIDGDGDRDGDDFFQYLDLFAQGCP
ncbi:MAG: choice-of-anchor B family protein [Phycisphaeraceae bacterium]|nr:choice-of-anchor B family protein [Phycisphaeraceae bacterium]